ncbi:metallophosphoesterase family protein [Pseudooceanicola sp. LIPI14-2-Ac024]|uniref:metallophosphoesterase family protein n=1 Tax=Pseudooceanicola sp. LIPI14-2-Ac024 TaxID=3344875 RepID=UPI0035CF99CA
MTRLIHLSDLHFGRDRPELLDPLITAVNDLRPDLVAISGDLTQRALDSQFRAARAFIDRIEAPVLSVPGNHDIPLHLPVTRLLRPFHNYRQWIARDLKPTAQLDGMTVIGLNTVDRYRWQRGRIRSRHVRRACSVARDSRPGDLVVLVAHHPFEHAPGVEKRLMRGADKAIDRLADCGADVILSGHLHLWRTEPFLTRPFGANILQIHAGTGLSTRQRGEPNDFACIDRDGEVLRVARWIASPGDAAFAESTIRHFGRTPTGWRTLDGQGPIPAGAITAPTAPSQGAFA